MKPFRELILSQVGKAAIVCGGADSAPADFERAIDGHPDACIISANQHGLWLSKRVDYITCYDNIHGILVDTCKTLEMDTWPPVISYHPLSTYRLLEYPVWPMSGQLACWIAAALGCCPIILVGMGCYKPGEGTYFHDATFQSEGLRIPLETHLADWGRVKKALASARIRATSGPLLSMFPAFDPAEKHDDYVLPDRLALLASQTGKVVKITHAQGARVGADCFEQNTIVELPKKDAEHLFRRRRAVPARI